MKPLLSRIFQSNKPDHQPQSLKEIRKFENNLEYVPGSNHYPSHLIAHGNIVSSESSTEIKTAVNVQGPDTEFSTNVGQVPNTPLGASVTEGLNHRLKGKVVTFRTDQQDKSDLVYATQRPTNWLNRKNFHRELEDHAKTKETVQGVLGNPEIYRTPKSGMGYPKIKDVGQDIVDSSLDLQKRVQGKLTQGRYTPTNLNLIDKSENF